MKPLILAVAAILLPFSLWAGVWVITEAKCVVNEKEESVTCFEKFVGISISSACTTNENAAPLCDFVGHEYTNLGVCKFCEVKNQ